MKPPPVSVYCDTIPYRRGMVEVANIHPRCVNIEAWDVSAASEGWLSAKELSEDDIVGNTEVELTVDQARELAAALLAAADAAAIESVP